MRYTLETAGELIEVEVRHTKDGRDYDVRIGDGRTRRVSARIDPASVHLRIEDASFQVLVGQRQDSESLDLFTLGQTRTVTVLDEHGSRLRARPGAAIDAGGEEVIRSPMPGKIVGILAEPGQLVEPGQGVVIVEAMKMENELRASKRGIVKAVYVGSGDLVEHNAILCLIGPDEE